MQNIGIIYFASENEKKKLDKLQTRHGRKMVQCVLAAQTTKPQRVQFFD